MAELMALHSLHDLHALSLLGDDAMCDVCARNGLSVVVASKNLATWLHEILASFDLPFDSQKIRSTHAVSGA